MTNTEGNNFQKVSTSVINGSEVIVFFLRNGNDVVIDHMEVQTDGKCLDVDENGCFRDKSPKASVSDSFAYQARELAMQARAHTILDAGLKKGFLHNATPEYKAVSQARDIFAAKAIFFQS